MDFIPAEIKVLRFEPKGKRKCKVVEPLQTSMDGLTIKAAECAANEEAFQDVVSSFEKAFQSEELAVNATWGVLRYTLVRLAKGCSALEATKPLSNGLCPVSGEALGKFAECVAEKCLPVIQAIRLMLRLSVGTVDEYIKQGSFTLAPPDDGSDVEEHDNNDPVNGCFVNKKYAELLAAEELAKSQHDKETLAQINGQIVELLNDEAEQGNPLAIYYLGVCCVVGSMVEKNMDRGAQLLVTAEQMGVRRASVFLSMYFAH